MSEPTERPRVVQSSSARRGECQFCDSADQAVIAVETERHSVTFCKPCWAAAKEAEPVVD